MTQPLLKVRETAMALPVDERLALVTQLWESLSSEPILPGDEEAVELALIRAQEIDEGVATMYTHEEVTASVEKIINEARLSP